MATTDKVLVDDIIDQQALGLRSYVLIFLLMLALVFLLVFLLVLVLVLVFLLQPPYPK